MAAPSDRWLRIFVAVVDNGSFTAAARRLDIGQPAVSHAVARLESALGTQLLERTSRALEVTHAGRLLHERLAAAFDEIDEAVAVASPPPASTDVVTLSVSTSLASWWLLPRLPDFKQRWADIDLRVITTDSDDLVGLDDADIWIPLGLTSANGLEATPFRVQELVPVASPTVAESLKPPPVEPAELLKTPLLHLEERYESRYSWERWFSDHGVELRAPLTGYRTNDYSLLLQAALDGQGVALGWGHIVTDLIEQDRLVALAEPMVTGEPFPMLHRPTESLRDDVRTLVEWLSTTA